jgi:hypothetical protein
MVKKGEFSMTNIFYHSKQEFQTVTFYGNHNRTTCPENWRGSVNFRRGRGMPKRASDWSPV